MNKSNNTPQWEKEFDEIFPCMQKEQGCSNDGIVLILDDEGDWEQSQCEYCYRVRFPVKDFISKTIEKERVDAYQDGYKDEYYKSTKEMADIEENARANERKKVIEEVIELHRKAYDDANNSSNGDSIKFCSDAVTNVSKIITKLSKL